MLHRGGVDKVNFELAYLNERGEIARGGIYDDVSNVAQWIAQAMEDDPDTTYFAIPANEDAISFKEALKRITYKGMR